MRISFRTVVVLVAALAVLAGPSAGATAFKGKVCSLVSPKTITAIKDVSSACTEAEPAPIARREGLCRHPGKASPRPRTSKSPSRPSRTRTLSLAIHNLKQKLCWHAEERVRHRRWRLRSKERLGG